jgi:predicted metal-binding membrane protein
MQAPEQNSIEARVARLEADVATIKIDVAVIKANGATKADIAELRSEVKTEIAELRSETKAEIADVRTAIADARATIIMWVAGIAFFGQILPSVIRLIEKYL